MALFKLFKISDKDAGQLAAEEIKRKYQKEYEEIQKSTQSITEKEDTGPESRSLTIQTSWRIITNSTYLWDYRINGEKALLDSQGELDIGQLHTNIDKILRPRNATTEPGLKPDHGNQIEQTEQIDKATEKDDTHNTGEAHAKPDQEGNKKGKRKKVIGTASIKTKVSQAKDTDREPPIKENEPAIEVIIAHRHDKPKDKLKFKVNFKGVAEDIQPWLDEKEIIKNASGRLVEYILGLHPKSRNNLIRIRKSLLIFVKN